MNEPSAASAAPKRHEPPKISPITSPGYFWNGEWWRTLPCGCCVERIARV